MEIAPVVELSIVVCVLDEEASIDAFVAAVDGVLPSLDVAGHEYLFVDDGSSDGTWPRIKALAAGRDDVVGLRLLRNVGKENALAAGLAAASGAVQVPMDVDLQDPPTLLADLVREWRGGATVVLARRRQRKDSRLRRTAAFFTYRMLESGGAVTIPRDVGDFRLMTSDTTLRFLALRSEAVTTRGCSRWSRPTRSSWTTTARPRARATPGPEADAAEARPPGDERDRLLQHLAAAGAQPGGLPPARAVDRGRRARGGAARDERLEVPGQATVVVLFAFLLGFQALSTGILGLYVAQILTEVNAGRCSPSSRRSASRPRAWSASTRWHALTPVRRRR